jgi:UDP:flavonoid glycosyltransferase YjiC (YdhE family)
VPRIVLACWGSYGDLFPYLAIATALRDRGHDAVVATAPYYREIVSRTGIGFHPMRPDLMPSDTTLIARVMDPARGGGVVIGEITAPAVRDAFADLAPLVKTADLLLSHPITFAAPLAAAVHRIRWLSTVLAPTSFFSLSDLPVLPPLPPAVQIWRSHRWAARAFFRVARRITRPWTADVRAFRADLGLADAGEPLYEGQFSPHGTLALFSTVLGAPHADWPRATRGTGFAFHADDAATPSAVADFLDEGDPPIVFTLGTSAAGAPGTFYEESLAAARAVGRRALLLVGRQASPDIAGLRAPDVMVADYARHQAVFPRAAAIVHHGGIGTMARAGGRPSDARRAARARSAGQCESGRTTRRRARHRRPTLSIAARGGSSRRLADRRAISARRRACTRRDRARGWRRCRV